MSVPMRTAWGGPDSDLADCCGDSVAAISCKAALTLRTARRKGRAALIEVLRPDPLRRQEKERYTNKNLPGAGESALRNVPRGTFRRPAILQKQCSTWNILSKIRSAPLRNSHYI